MQKTVLWFRSGRWKMALAWLGLHSSALYISKHLPRPVFQRPFFLYTVYTVHAVPIASLGQNLVSNQKRGWEQTKKPQSMYIP